MTTAALAIVVIPNLGWRWMFVIGALPALVLVPLMFRYLPESAVLPGRARPPGRGRGGRPAVRPRAGGPGRARRGDAGETAGATVKTLFTSAYLRNTIAIGVTSFMGLLLVYGLNTWLPTIMREADYELGAALAFLLVLNVGAIVGLLIAGTVADRIGPGPRASSGSPPRRSSSRCCRSGSRSPAST